MGGVIDSSGSKMVLIIANIESGSLMSGQACEKWVIEGVKEDGQRFRPSDWIERLSTLLATYGRDHRIHYSDKVQPVVVGGVRCLIVDESLKDENPAAYEHIMGFAKSNNLRTHIEEE